MLLRNEGEPARRAGREDRGFRVEPTELRRNWCAEGTGDGNAFEKGAGREDRFEQSISAVGHGTRQHLRVWDRLPDTGDQGVGHLPGSEGPFERRWRHQNDGHALSCYCMERCATKCTIDLHYASICCVLRYLTAPGGKKWC